MVASGDKLLRRRTARVLTDSSTQLNLDRVHVLEFSSDRLSRESIPPAAIRTFPEGEGLRQAEDETVDGFRRPREGGSNSDGLPARIRREVEPGDSKRDLVRSRLARPSGVAKRARPGMPRPGRSEWRQGP